MFSNVCYFYFKYKNMYILYVKLKSKVTLQNLQNVDYFTKYEGSCKLLVIVYLVLT